MTTDIAPKASRKAWLGVAVLALPTLLVSMDFSVLYLALPHLSAALAPTSIQQLWIVDIYGFVIAGFLVTMGTLGDKIGRRKLLLIGAAGFGVALLLAAFSVSAAMLIIARALLGVAGATLMPSTLSLISTMFSDDRQRGLAITVWLSVFMGGLAIGPIVGGALLQFFWWGSVFLFGVPLMAVLLILGPIVLPEHRNPDAGRLDLISVALSLLAILPFIYGLKELARAGAQPLYVAALVVGIVFGVLFVLRQRQLEHPLLDLSLFRIRSFRSSLGILVGAGIVGTGSMFIVGLYLQTVAGLSALNAGLILLPATLLMILGNQVAPLITRRVRPAYVIAGSLVIGAAGYLILTQVSPAAGLSVLVIAWIIAQTGNGPMGGLTNTLALTSIPPERTGSAAAVLQTNNEAGLGLGIATLGTLGTVIYRNQIADRVPANIPSGAARGVRDSIDNAVAAAATLPRNLSGEVLVPARNAFASALHVVGLVCGVIYVALAVLTVVALRHVPATQATPVETASDTELDAVSETEAA